MMGEQEGNNAIKDILMTDKPVMVGRFGKLEAECVYSYFSSGDWDSYARHLLNTVAGFFPTTNDMLKRFSIEYVEHAKNADVMSCWLGGMDEGVVSKNNPPPIIVPLKSLEPYYYNHPWSIVLAGKRVLVVHPYEDSIKAQYEKRHLLFKDPEVLPDFELVTVKAVQSNALNPVPFENWFDALKYMCDEIAKKDFDIAIVGAGAYSLPLTSFAKSLGKKAIQISGATQILFGIKGRRWDNMPCISQFYNEHWVRPLPSETPSQHMIVENGCYW